MEPIKYVDALNDYYGAMGHPAYQWTVNETAPLHRLDKPLSECTVSLLTSGGVSQCSMPAFNPDARNDHRLDAIGVGPDHDHLETIGPQPLADDPVLLRCGGAELGHEGVGAVGREFQDGVFRTDGRRHLRCFE